MNILITGANGQLGNEMRALSVEHPEHSYFFTDVNELDITNERAVVAFMKRFHVNLIVNCAAYTAVDRAEDEPGLCDRLNREAPGILAETAKNFGASMIHISTDYVFDGTAHTPYAEFVMPSPNSVYGRTKLAGEEEVRRHCPECMIIRTAWLYSTYGNNFVKTMIRLGREREELGVVFDQIGTPTYARDLARAIYASIERGVVVSIYHFSNEGVCSWYDFTVAIHRLADINTCRVKPIHSYEFPAKAPRPSYSVLDKSRIKSALNLQIPHWEESLKECIEQLKAEEQAQTDGKQG